MATEIKICGIRTADALDAALAAGADHVGFVFFPPSPRAVSVEEAAQLADIARGRARIVALVVDPSHDLLAEIIREVGPDVVQFHGRETPEQIREFRLPQGVEVWKALPVSDASDLEMLADYAPLADRILFDAKPPKDATRPGGHGRSFDWTLLRGLDPSGGFMLSGGLNADNVPEALKVSGLRAVDVSSGVETAPGEKSPDLIRAFIQAVRGAEARQEKQSS
jgi:phosphoribosylanthranilate isomerase